MSGRMGPCAVDTLCPKQQVSGSTGLSSSSRPSEHRVKSARRSRMTTGLLALILMIFNAAVVAWMIWAFRDPTTGYGAGYVGIFVAILTVLGAILGVSSLVDKSGRAPGAIALAICGAGLLLALYSMIAEVM